MQHPARHRRFVTWLAMAAMALIMVAPVISRVAPLWHATSDPAVMAMGADSHAGEPGAPPHGHLLDKCTYCDLLGHSPVMAGVPWVAAALPVAPVAPAALPATMPWFGHAMLTSLPRGPPVLAGG